jgi:hypothetical protein
MTSPVPPINTAVLLTPINVAQPSQNSPQTPAVLANLPNGTLISGFVVNRDPRQNPVLRTVLGDILVQSNFFLKTGAEVEIRVDTTLAGRARIISINGQNPQEYAANNTNTSLAEDSIAPSPFFARPAGVASTGQAAQSSATANLFALRTPAVLVSAQAQPLPLPNAATSPFQLPDGSAFVPSGTALTMLARLAQGKNIMATVLALQLPELRAQTQATAGSAPQITQSATNTAPIASPSAQNNPALSTQSTVPSLPSQPAVLATPVALNPLTHAPDSPRVFHSNPAVALAAEALQPNRTSNSTAAMQPTPPMASPLISVAARTPVEIPAAALNHTVIAQVIGHEQDGSAIIQAGGTTIKLLTAQPLPTGTQLAVSLNVASAAQLQAPTALPLDDAMSDTVNLLSRWSTLDDALSSLTQQQPAVAAQFLTQHLPQPDGKLTAGLLFLIAALRQGDVKQFMGDKAWQALDSIEPELLKKLSGEISQMQTTLRDAAPGQWTTLTLPVHVERQIEPLRMYFKREENDASSKGAGRAGGQRFILEVTLSHLGDMQFDGFVKVQESPKQFDMMVRSARHLPIDISASIRQKYEAALGATGMKGYIGFQVGHAFFVRPLQEVKESVGIFTVDHGLMA